MTITDSDDEKVLLRSDANGLITLQLNRPNQFNALSDALLAALN